MLNSTHHLILSLWYCTDLTRSYAVQILQGCTFIIVEMRSNLKRKKNHSLSHSLSTVSLSLSQTLKFRLLSSLPPTLEYSHKSGPENVNKESTNSTNNPTPLEINRIYLITHNNNNKKIDPEQEKPTRPSGWKQGWIMPFMSRYRLSNSKPLGFGRRRSTGTHTPVSISIAASSATSATVCGYLSASHR